MGQNEKKETAKPDGPTTTSNTSKFAVLDYPGQPQPAPAATVTTTPGTKAANKASASNAQGRRTIVSDGPQMSSSSSRVIGGDSYTGRTPNPEWLAQRCAVFDRVQELRAAELATKKPVPITVTLPDGKVLTESSSDGAFMAWKTSPYDVAKAISQGLADSVSVARVTYSEFVEDYSLFEDGMETVDPLSDVIDDDEENKEEGNGASKTYLWDMTRPLVGSVSKMEFLKFEGDPEAKTVFWHSSAHMMGEALEHVFGSKLTIGPPLAGGFYYDSYMGTDTMADSDCKCS